MIHCPSEHNGRCWTKPRPGHRNLFHVSHVGAGSQSFGPSSTAFPGHRQGAGWEVELPGLELVPIWDLGAFKVRTLAARPRHCSQLIWSFNQTRQRRWLCTLQTYAGPWVVKGHFYIFSSTWWKAYQLCSIFSLLSKATYLRSKNKKSFSNATLYIPASVTRNNKWFSPELIETISCRQQL